MCGVIGSICGSMGLFIISGPLNLCCCIPAIAGGFSGGILGSITDLVVPILAMCGGAGQQLAVTKGMEMIKIG